jgi:hypothetical protein
VCKINTHDSCRYELNKLRSRSEEGETSFQCRKVPKNSRGYSIPKKVGHTSPLLKCRLYEVTSFHGKEIQGERNDFIVGRPDKWLSQGSRSIAAVAISADGLHT